MTATYNAQNQQVVGGATYDANGNQTGGAQFSGRLKIGRYGQRHSEIRADHGGGTLH